MKVELIKRETENPARPVHFLVLKPTNQEDDVLLETMIMQSNSGQFFNPGTVLRAGKSNKIASITLVMHRDTI